MSDINLEPVVKAALAKGVTEVDLSMFPEDDQREVYAAVAEILLRQGKLGEAMAVLETIKMELPRERFEPLADYFLGVQEYKAAALLFEKIGEHQISSFLKLNCLGEAA